MMVAFEVIVIALLGLVLGSFATALSYRTLNGISWSGIQRSACTACNKQLAPRDLIPVLSWLIQKGKCRQCGAPISKRYPVIELSVMLACIVAYLFNGFTPETFFICAAVPFLVALLLIDLKEMILPNSLVAIVGGIGLARALFHTAMAWPAGFSHILFPLIGGALLYGGLAWFLGWVTTKILKRDSLGFGDVKFFAAAGLWLGITKLGMFCLLSGVIGVFFALGWRMVVKERHFPFGPALITSLYLLLLL